MNLGIYYLASRQNMSSEFIGNYFLKRKAMWKKFSLIFRHLVTYDPAVVTIMYESVPGVVSASFRLLALGALICFVYRTLTRYPTKKSFYIPFTVFYASWLILTVSLSVFTILMAQTQGSFSLISKLIKALFPLNPISFEHQCYCVTRVYKIKYEYLICLLQPS